MRQIKIALAVLKQSDKFLLQKRGSNPVIGGAGLVGCFGGKIEDETPLEAACREVAEETNLKLDPNSGEHLGAVDVTSDHNLEPVAVNAQVYQFELDDETQIKATEGDLVELTIEQALQQLDNMTTGTAAIFRQLIETQSHIK